MEIRGLFDRAVIARGEDPLAWWKPRKVVYNICFEGQTLHCSNISASRFDFLETGHDIRK